MSKRKREMAIARKEFNKRREEVVRKEHEQKKEGVYWSKMRKMYVGVDKAIVGKDSLQVATALDHLEGNR